MYPTLAAHPSGALLSCACAREAVRPAHVKAVTYVLTVAELHGLRVVDAERRRALVLSALLGREGSEVVQGQLGLSTLFWAAQVLTQMQIGRAHV